MYDQKLDEIAIKLFTAKRQYGILNRDVAAKIGWSFQYFSEIINGKRKSSIAEEKIRAALAELIAEKQTSPQ